MMDNVDQFRVCFHRAGTRSIQWHLMQVGLAGSVKTHIFDIFSISDPQNTETKSKFISPETR
jgi:hypothetical protein